MEAQKIDNKLVIAALVFLIVGGIIGWALASRSARQGPLAGMDPMSSAASGVCASHYGSSSWQDAGVVTGGDGTIYQKCYRKGVYRYITLSTPDVTDEELNELQ